MKNKLKKIIILPLLSLTAAATFTACSEWTDSQSVGIKEPVVGEQNPELYARYLANLRIYKASDHPVVYTYFDNSEKQPVSRAHHLTTLPDSVDIVSVLHPDNLHKWELDELQLIRRDKGMKVLSMISYAAIEALYLENNPVTPPQESPEIGDNNTGDQDTTPEADVFIPFLTERADYLLSLVDKYGYDGVSVHYEPLPLLHLKPEDRAREQARQEVFVAKLAAWTTAHPDKMFVLDGAPQNLIDKSLLASCRYLVLRAFDAISHTQLTINLKMAIRDGVPVDRFIVCVTPFSLDAADLKTGRFADQTGKLTLSAVTETAAWVMAPEAGFSKVGLGIYNIQNDYYNTSLIYKYTREAISVMNPSPNK